MENGRQLRYELLEWHDRRYQHVQYLQGTQREADEAVRRLNRGYTGPRFVIRLANA